MLSVYPFDTCVNTLKREIPKQSGKYVRGRLWEKLIPISDFLSAVTRYSRQSELLAPEAAKDALSASRSPALCRASWRKRLALQTWVLPRYQDRPFTSMLTCECNDDGRFTSLALKSSWWFLTQAAVHEGREQKNWNLVTICLCVFLLLHMNAEQFSKLVLCFWVDNIRPGAARSYDSSLPARALAVSCQVWSPL